MTAENAVNAETDGSARIEVRIDRRVATLTIDRPPLNVLDLDTLETLDETFEALADEEGLQAIVLRGGGERAFSAGVSIEDHDPAKIDRMLGVFHRALRRLLDLDAATVAAVDGHCLGGGLELASCCDLILASSRSTFGQPEIRLGCFPPVAAVVLPHRIGVGATADLVLTGRVLGAAEAAHLRLVDRLAGDDFEGALERLLSELRQSSAAALACAKRALRAGDPRRRAVDEALVESERVYREELSTCEDLVEGIGAFLDKRPPRWRHR